MLIAGGGIGGLAAALCLAREGIEAAVFERQPTFAELGAGIQISPNASRVLHHLGLAESLQRCASQPQGTEFRSWRSGRLVSRAELGHAARSAYGFPYYHVHRGDLLRMLTAAAEQSHRIALHANAEVTRFETTADGVSATVAGHREATHHGAALIGADGIHSTVRTQLFGASSATFTGPTFTGNVAWRALVPVARLPAGLARPVGTVWWGPRRHFVHYLVRGGALANCVCVVEKRGWEVESWTQRGELAELRADFAGWHENVRHLIAQMDANALYKWALFDRPPSPHWGKGPVTLLGDACHPMLPFVAQGAATAIEDAAVLASCLANMDDVPAALERYAALRRKRTAWIQGLARRNARIFHLSGPAAWARNLAAKRGGERIMDAVYGFDALATAG